VFWRATRNGNGKAFVVLSTSQVLTGGVVTSLLVRLETGRTCIELLRRDKTPVSKATVYRTLALVTESGLIDGHDFDKGKRLYEPMVGRAHHDHMYCITCGKVIEFEEEAIERLQEMVTQRHRFTAVYHSHKIFGYCAACGGPKPVPKGGRP